MLSFDVINQTLKRVDRFSPATDSVDYLQAVFNFKTNDWNDKTKYALFRLGTKTYAKALDSKNTCIVPFEVLKATDESKASIGAKNKVFITLVGEKGTVRVPTNALRVDLETSGYADAENGKAPTPDLYAQYVEVVEAAVAEHAANAANSMDIANEKAAEASESAASLKNDYSNALKGVASGAVVRVDDVSPVEHYPVVEVHGKNLFDISKITNATHIVNNGDGTLSVTSITDSYSAATGKTLRELAPSLKEGEVYTLTALTDVTANVRKKMYLSHSKGNRSWMFGETIMLDTIHLDSRVYFYANDNENVTTISNIQIELGDTATEYTPYVDPSTVTVTRCGKNLVNSENFVSQKAGYFANVTLIKSSNNGKSITVKGAEGAGANAHSSGWLVLNYGNSINLKLGDEVTISADVALVEEGIFGNVIKFAIINDTAGKTSSSANLTLGNRTRYTATRVAQADGLHRILIMVNNNTIDIDNIMVTVNGESVYEDYMNGETYTPNADGTVNGLTSVSPTMTLLTDTEGVTIECEYNQDANKVFERLKNAIIALGGVV